MTAQPTSLAGLDLRAEIDRLRDQKGQRHDQSELADQALREEPSHNFFTSAASI
jgi:hypothetical protein